MEWAFKEDRVEATEVCTSYHTKGIMKHQQSMQGKETVDLGPLELSCDQSANCQEVDGSSNGTEQKDRKNSA